MTAISFAGSPFAFDPIGMTRENAAAARTKALQIELETAPAPAHDDAVDALAPSRCTRRYVCSMDHGHEGPCSQDRDVFTRCPRCNRPHGEHRRRFDPKRGTLYCCPPRRHERPGTNRPKRVCA